MPEQSATVVAGKEILFGSISGMAGKIVEYPFDTIKVRLQSQPSTGKQQYASTLDCIKQSLRSHGVSGFYRGLSAPVVGAMFENAILFVSYSKASDLVRSVQGGEKSKELDVGGIMVAGALSGIVTSFVLTPIELVKCQLQVASLQLPKGAEALAAKDMSSTKHSMHAHAGRSLHTSTSSQKAQTITSLVKQIYKLNGLKGFWRGQFSTLIRESGGSCCWFSIYELSLRYLRAPGSTKRENTQGHLLMAGALAGVGYNSLFFPFDTIKSRMQTNASSAGFTGVIREVWAHHGISGCFKGCGITVCRAAPSNALVFLVYESLVRRFM